MLEGRGSFRKTACFVEARGENRNSLANGGMDTFAEENDRCDGDYYVSPRPSRENDIRFRSQKKSRALFGDPSSVKASPKVKKYLQQPTRGANDPREQIEPLHTSQFNHKTTPFFESQCPPEQPTF